MRHLLSATVERIFCLAILQLCPIELQAKIFSRVVEILKDPETLAELEKLNKETM
jgi:hypothetical protein